MSVLERRDAPACSLTALSALRASRTTAHEEGSVLITVFTLTRRASLTEDMPPITVAMGTSWCPFLMVWTAPTQLPCFAEES